MLLKKASALVKSRVEGQELLHQTLFELCGTPEKMNRMERVTLDGKLEAFICVGMYRSIKPNGGYTRAKMHTTDFVEPKSDIYENINSKLSNRIANEQIDLLISRLPDFDAELLLLWAMPGFSYKKAAEATGMDIQKLRMLNFKSLQKIRKYVHRTPISITGQDE